LFRHEDRNLEEVTTFNYMYKMFYQNEKLIEDKLKEDDTKEAVSSIRRLKIFQ
jgi:hypothetical protein